jgi:hypothetical protein
MTVVTSPEMQFYLEAIMILLAGYHIAYLFKNYSRLLGKQGALMFVFTVVWMFSFITIVTIGVEGHSNGVYTSAYLLGFGVRFFRYDS